MEKTLIS